MHSLDIDASVRVRKVAQPPAPPSGRETPLDRPRAPALTGASRPRALPRLSARAAFVLQASITMFFLAGSSAPTPLYPVYQAEWGFSPITVTVVFGVYAIAVLSALLTIGSLSDYVGRRPVLIAATALQAITMLVFARAGGVGSLVVARVIQGLSTGAAVGAVGAGLLDIDRARGTVANAVVPLFGTATGSIVSGLMVQYLPAPTRLVYLTLAAIFLIQCAGAALMPESARPRPGAWRSLRPHFRVPPALRAPLLTAVPVLVASWSLAGFYGSLGPTLVRRITGSQSLLLGGLVLFVLAGSGALAVLWLRARSARELMSGGIAALLVGVATTLFAASHAATALFFTGAVVTGAGFGAGFQGAIRTVIPLASAQDRAGVLSVLYVVSYLAMGAPAVLAGFGVVYGGGLLATTREYGAGTMILATLALCGAWRAHRRALRAVT